MKCLTSGRTNLLSCLWNSTEFSHVVCEQVFVCYSHYFTLSAHRLRIQYWKGHRVTYSKIKVKFLVNSVLYLAQKTDIFSFHWTQKVDIRLLCLNTFVCFVQFTICRRSYLMIVNLKMNAIEIFNICKTRLHMFVFEQWFFKTVIIIIIVV